MSYIINATSFEDIWLPIESKEGKAKAIGLFVLYASMISEQVDEETTENGRQILKLAGQMKGKKWTSDDYHSAEQLMRKIMELWYSPFVIDPSSEKIVSFDFCYDYGGKWDGDKEKIFVNAFAKFARAGAYIGFEGEDGALWSYVYDGKGSYQECYPQIDWRSGYTGETAPAAPSPAQPSAQRPFYVRVDDAKLPGGLIAIYEVRADSEEEAVRKTKEKLIKECFAVSPIQKGDDGTPERDIAEEMLEEEEAYFCRVIHID